MDDPQDEWVLKPNKYSGTLDMGDASRPVNFSAEIGRDHRCKVEFDPVDKETYLLAHKHSGRSGLKEAGLTLAGTADNGDTLTFKGVWISQLGRCAGGFYLRPVVGETTARVPMSENQDRPLLRKWFRSFRSFRNAMHHTPLGDVLVYGSEKSVNPDEVSGCVTVQAPSCYEGENWKGEAEAFLAHMHYGLSFVHGGRLQVPRLDYVAGNVWEATIYHGSGFAPELALQHFLHHDPFIQALVDGFFNRGPLDDGFLTALGWLQMPTTFDEIRFLSAMTALEVIVETQLSAGEKGGIMQKSEFRALRESLYRAIDETAGVTPEAKAIFKARISDANQKTLSQKIDALFKRLAIPERDFDKDTIKRLTRIRNEIVHQGIVSNPSEIWDEVVLIRELINRILMGAIGFEGRYLCYIGGQHERTFPDLRNFSR